MTFLCAASTLLVGMLGALRYRLPTDKVDMAPSLHWTEPAPAFAVKPEQGPVLVLAEYRITAANSEACASVMHEFRATRLRDGALDWTL